MIYNQQTYFVVATKNAHAFLYQGHPSNVGCSLSLAAAFATRFHAEAFLKEKKEEYKMSNWSFDGYQLADFEVKEVKETIQIV